MARVKLEELMDHLDDEMRAVLRAAVREVLPQAEFDDEALFRAFRQAVRRRCDRWESVPDRVVHG